MQSHSVDSRSTRRRVTRLVVVSHAEDETRGCGGMLAKHRHESAVVVLADLDEDRMLQFKKAQVALGYAESFFFGLTEGDIGADMHRLVGMLENLTSVMCPSELYLPFPSVDLDRVAAYEAGMRSVRLATARHHRLIPTVLLYDGEARSTSEYSTDLNWNRIESLSQADLDRQTRALRGYLPDNAVGVPDVQMLKERAHDVGSILNLPWAEQFAIVRASRVTAPGSPPGVRSNRLSTAVPSEILR